MTQQHNLVGGFNPSEKYQSNGKSSPNSGENRKYLKPPPSNDSTTVMVNWRFGVNWWFGIRIGIPPKNPKNPGLHFR